MLLETGPCRPEPDGIGMLVQAVPGGIERIGSAMGGAPVQGDGVAGLGGWNDAESKKMITMAEY
jgi:hypothetical protein